jgi:hypothetical protein
MSIKPIPADLREQVRSSDFSTGELPVKRDLRVVYVFSLLIAALTAIASTAGLLAPETFYPTEALQRAYLTNDIFTLILGLPILLISMWLAWRKKLIGLLFWPGALLYGLYNYVAYLFGMPFAGLFFLYLVIVVLSLYTLIALISSIDGQGVTRRLSSHVPERLGGGVLMFLGSAFVLLASGVLISNLTGSGSMSQAELAVFVADFFAAPAWVIGGLLLWRREPLGYAGGTGLLFSVSMLFVGVIGIVLLQWVLDGGPFPLVDIALLLIMGLLCFIPFGFFARGVLKS